MFSGGIPILVGAQLSPMWIVGVNRSGIEPITKDSSAILLRGVLRKDLNGTNIGITLDTSNSAISNVVFSDGGKTAVLITKSVSLTSPDVFLDSNNTTNSTNQTSNTNSTSIAQATVVSKNKDPVISTDDDPVPNTMVSSAEAIQSLSRGPSAAAAASVIATSTFSINLGPAFIKFFQIVEILGKLYFTPIEYSNLLDFFLSTIYGFSDLIQTPVGFILG